MVKQLNSQDLAKKLPVDIEHRNPKKAIAKSSNIKGGLLSVPTLDSGELALVVGDDKYQEGQRVYAEDTKTVYVLKDQGTPTDPASYELEGEDAAAAKFDAVNLYRGIETISTNQNVSDGKFFIKITGSPIITMPDPSGADFITDDGKINNELFFDHIDEFGSGGIATLSPFGGEDIEETQIYAGEKWVFYSDGTNWRVKS